MKTILTILKTTIFLTFGSIILLTISAYLNLPLPLKPLVVMSGSMEPKIHVGSVIFVNSENNLVAKESYHAGDVITFKLKNELVSHRIVSYTITNSGDKFYQTKGDANASVDSQLVAAKDIVGKISFSIPYIGKFVSFVKAPVGFLLLIITPTLLIIASEALAIWEELRKKKAKDSKLDFAKPVAMFFLAAIFVSSSHAFFSDVGTSTSNVFSAAANFGINHLVINEVYYDPDSAHMQGTSPDENDFEWIEIYNPTSLTVNVKDWKVVDNSGAEKTVSTSNRNIGPGQFAVLAKAANVFGLWSIPSSAEQIQLGEVFGNGLSNSGDRVVLKDSLGNLIDQMSYGTDTTVFNPSATDVVEGHSLERDPDGIDTNTAADFINRVVPTPGL